jgi:hypothetical protein
MSPSTPRTEPGEVSGWISTLIEFLAAVSRREGNLKLSPLLHQVITISYFLARYLPRIPIPPSVLINSILFFLSDEDLISYFLSPTPHLVLPCPAFCLSVCSIFDSDVFTVFTMRCDDAVTHTHSKSGKGSP